ncbi:ATP-binding protein [Caulobacter sp. SL161]|uniref:ATP-binding protein n=1 Tax=Caulobacter sp. SL161 TaxID=2995156 RepID=UPI00227603A9|nr:ATP-binding protein [Caulobacter sp. SL161]MCY1647465.1 ATP-binding protein [Caulobacter sp. SL161]
MASWAQWRAGAVPLRFQIVALLLVVLVVAQLATLGLTILLPSKPTPKYRMMDVALALKGGPLKGDNPRPLERVERSQPPNLESPNWVVSEQSRAELARMLDAPVTQVRILFYAPPSLTAGAPIVNLSAAQPAPGVQDAAYVEQEDQPRLIQAAWHGAGEAQSGPGAPPGGAPPMGGGFPGGGFPGGGFPAGAPARPPSPPTVPPAAVRPAPPPVVGAPTAPSGSATMNRPPAPGVSAGPAAAAAPPVSPPVSPAGPLQIGSPSPGGVGAPSPILTSRAAPAPALKEPFNAPSPLQAEQARAADPVTPRSVTPETPVAAAQAPRDETFENAARIGPITGQESAGVDAADTGGYLLPSDNAPPKSFLGLSPPPFVQGDFVAALQVAPDRWITVQPAPETFPNTFQRRTALWFLLSALVVVPVGLIFARRLAQPLVEFADAAERLGRDPSGQLAPLAGPAEIGRAAAAFNLMQKRLKRYIDDRTAMVGAISHDLRTPLARMRFRLERIDSEVKAGMSHDITQMDEMISAVLAFIRDSSEPSVRERVELRSILECVVDNAAIMGGDVTLDPGDRVPVDVDSLSVERVLTNLVDNALKYGDRARVRVFEDGGDVIAEVQDYGSGLPDEELEKVFLPFYRSDHSRNLNKTGIGLGLAVSRSIARAHGGDVSLSRGEHGLKAQLRLPRAPLVA